MLRKISHIIVTLLLITTTTGATFSMHYCGGELISASVNKEVKTCCDGTGECCENITIHLDIDDDYLGSIKHNNIKIADTQLLIPVFLFIYNQPLPVEEQHYDLLFGDIPNISAIQVRLALLQTYLC